MVFKLLESQYYSFFLKPKQGVESSDSRREITSLSYDSSPLKLTFNDKSTVWWQGENEIDSFNWNNVRSKNSIWKLKNLCYSKASEAFVMSRAELEKLPAFIRDSSKILQIDDKKQISTNVWWVPGVSLLFDDLRIEESGAHLFFHMLPVLSGWRMAKERWNDISITFKHTQCKKESDQQLWDLFMSQVPKESIIQLNQTRKVKTHAMICWQRAIRMDQSYIGIAESPALSSYLKELIRDKYQIKIPLHCKQLEETDKYNIWIVQRRVRARQIINMDAIIDFLEQRGISRNSIQVFDSPNAVCSPCGCFGYPVCNHITEESKKTCRRKGHRLEEDIALFSKITLLISVHGAGNVHYLWMPPGAHVLEIFPYHFLPTSVYQNFANMSQLKYFRYTVTDSTIYKQQMETRTHNFTTHQCWADNQCRPKVKQLPVLLPLQGENNFLDVLEKVLLSWKNTCINR
eukprot:jgi/Galph1/2403/GphlegSOOS_G1037.1